MNYLAETMSQGEPVKNTVKLRNEYTNYRVQAETSGEPVLTFDEWVQANYPDRPVLRDQ